MVTHVGLRCHTRLTPERLQELAIRSSEVTRIRALFGSLINLCILPDDFARLPLTLPLLNTSPPVTTPRYLQLSLSHVMNSAAVCGAMYFVDCTKVKRLRLSFPFCIDIHDVFRPCITACSSTVRELQFNGDDVSYRCDPMRVSFPLLAEISFVSMENPLRSSLCTSVMMETANISILYLADVALTWTMLAQILRLCGPTLSVLGILGNRVELVWPADLASNISGLLPKLCDLSTKFHESLSHALPQLKTLRHLQISEYKEDHLLRLAELLENSAWLRDLRHLALFRDKELEEEVELWLDEVEEVECICAERGLPFELHVA